jgi:hypothetical protein
MFRICCRPIVAIATYDADVEQPEEPMTIIEQREYKLPLVKRLHNGKMALVVRKHSSGNVGGKAKPPPAEKADAGKKNGGGGGNGGGGKKDGGNGGGGEKKDAGEKKDGDAKGEEKKDEKADGGDKVFIVLLSRYTLHAYIFTEGGRR